MRIGLLVSRSGPAGLWAPSCDAGAMLAAAELNSGDGILGSSVELVIADAGWSDEEAIASSTSLVEIDEVDAVVGMHPSNIRAAVRRGLAARAPYVYTPQYEGGERSPYTLTTGGTDPELLAPAIAWLSEKRCARRYFLVGNDYIWPRMAHENAYERVRSAGGEIVGEEIVPFESEDYSELLTRIARARPDVLIMALLGSEAATFNRAFSEAGLAARILRLGLAIDESVLCAIGPEHTENLYATLNYFADIHSRANDRFREIFHDSFGAEAPQVNIACQSCYDGIHVVAGLARAVGRRDARSLAESTRRPVARSALRSPLVRSPMGSHLQAHLAIANGIEFRVLASH